MSETKSSRILISRTPSHGISNPSAVKPDALGCSSDGRAWKNLSVVRVRHEPGELAVPSLAAHTVVVQLTSAPLIITSIEGRRCDTVLRQEETAFIPARHAVVWRVPEASVCEVLHIHLHPSFVHRIAADGCDVGSDDWVFSPRI